MFNAPDSAAGKRAKCPKCSGVIQIPTPVVNEEVFDAEEAISQPFSDDDFAVEPPPELPAASDRKPCPMCGEMIQKSAVKCRHCGEIFDPLLKSQAKKASAPGDEDLSVFEWIVCIVCSGIGCIVGIIYLVQGKPKGKKMLLVSICVQVFWAVVQALIAAMGHR